MYDNSRDQIEKIIDIWKIIEILTPNPTTTLDKYFKEAKNAYNRDKKEFKAKFDHHEDQGFFLKDSPYLQPIDISLYKDGKDTYVCWHVYIGYFNWSAAEKALSEKVQQLFGEAEYKLLDRSKTNPVITPIAGFIINNRGILNEKSIVISTAAWALGRIMSPDFTQKDLDILLNCSIDTVQIISTIIKQSMDDSGNLALNFAKTQQITMSLIELLNIDRSFLIDLPEICIRKVIYQKSPQKDQPSKEIITMPYNIIPKLEMFNSFFIEELDLVKTQIPDLKENSAIIKYLGACKKPNSINLFENPLELKNLLHPSKMQYGRWPASASKCLAALQTASLNFILQTANNNENIFAINGPPGTGKTTTLFDLIANIYISRAINLAQLRSPEEGFIGKSIKHESHSKNYTFYTKSLKKELQGYSIVVASSNNTAVENITKELPLKSTVDNKYLSELRLFDWILDEDSKWGIFAAALGNKENINAFLKKFWQMEFPKDDEKYEGKTLFQYLELIKGNPKAQNKQLKSLIPGYCDEDFYFEWMSTCYEFNCSLEVIKDTYSIIDQIINSNLKKEKILNQYGQNIVEKLKLLNEDLNLLQGKLTNIDAKILSTNYKISERLKLNIWMWIHKLFNTKKYQVYYEETLRIFELYENLQTQKIEFETNLYNINKELTSINVDKKEVEKIDNLIEDSINTLKCYGVEYEHIMESSHCQESSYDNMHKVSPHHHLVLEERRSELFVQAVKLHEMFIHANAKDFCNSLKLFAAMLDGDTQPNSDITKIAWDNFFMVVPVISTAFHSFGNMFKNLKAQDLDWLIIDEAGQTPPQQAIGSIYRAKNIVVVGDPMQTVPISALCKSLIEKLFSTHNLNPKHWSPAEISVQNIADRISLYQTKYSNDITVGFPLIVHRRCQEPMFSICNTISYNNRMIYAVKPMVSPITKILGRSRWIDVIDPNATKSHFESQAEILYLLKMLKLVFKAPNGIDLIKKIYVISFYNDVKHQIKNMLKTEFNNPGLKKVIDDFCEKNLGTIHSFQGKENDTVIIMLGAQSPDDFGARNIMLRTPNVLNVGISRAQNNIYVIGNKLLWSTNTYMDIVNKMLESFHK